MDLKGDPTGMAEGVVIESRTEKGRGNVATLLVQRGELNIGDIIVAGNTWTKVRTMQSIGLANLTKASLSIPVEIDGWKELPSASDVVIQVPSETVARQVIEKRQLKITNKKETKSSANVKSVQKDLKVLSMEYRRLKYQKKKGQITAEETERLNQLIGTGGLSEQELQTVNVIVKGDVSGTVEAIVKSLEKFKSDELTLNVMHSGVGEISQSDVALAGTSGAIVVGFNVKASRSVKDLAATLGVQIRHHSIIYSLLEDINRMLSNMLEPVTKIVQVGEAQILERFELPSATVAGVRVKTGELKRSETFQVIRNESVIYEGKLSTLRILKKNVETASKGSECGLSFENFNDFKAGDIIRCVRHESESRTFEVEDTPVYVSSASASNSETEDDETVAL